jgi:hypothetical protein
MLMHFCAAAGAGGEVLEWMDYQADDPVGLLELAWAFGHLHTLPLLISMGLRWKDGCHKECMVENSFRQLTDTADHAMVRPADILGAPALCFLQPTHSSVLKQGLYALAGWGRLRCCT